MAVQIILSQVDGHSLCLQTQNIPSLDVLKQTIYQLKGIDTEDQRIIYNGHEVTGNDQFEEAISQDADFVPLRFSLRGCCGGKGGFGSLLRSAKSVKKTTNFGSCRDINGRRLRDVENEKRLAELSQEGERVDSEKKRKKEERKRDRGEGGAEGSHFKNKKKNFQDEMDAKALELSRMRKNALQNVNASVEKGLAILKKQQEEERKRKRAVIDLSSDDDDSDGEEPQKKKLRKEKKTEINETAPQLSITIPTPITTTTTPITTSTTPTNMTPTPIPKPHTTTTTATVPTITTVPTTIPSCLPKPPLMTEPSEPSSVKRTSTTESIGEKPLRTIDLSAYHSAFELESLGLETLKAELMHLGMKCGGNLKQRAERLWSTKDLTLAPSVPITTKAPQSSYKKKKT